MEHMPDEETRETIRGLVHARAKVLWEPELIALASVQDELNDLGFVLMWLDELPPYGVSDERQA